MDGILLFDKPIGWSSHDVVSFARKKLNHQKIGHAGTLDPLATGLLVLLLGKATRWSDYFLGMDKRYTCLMRLGFCTDTQDMEGRILSEANAEPITQDALQLALNGFQGKITQKTPIFSAAKVQGQKLYVNARKGKAQKDVKLRDVEVHKISLTHFDNPFAGLDVICSKGTYIRTLCADIGVALDNYACMAALRRTAIGRFSLGDAVTKDQFEKLNLEGINQHLINQLDENNLFPKP